MKAVHQTKSTNHPWIDLIGNVQIEGPNTTHSNLQPMFSHACASSPQLSQIAVSKLGTESYINSGPSSHAWQGCEHIFWILESTGINQICWLEKQDILVNIFAVIFAIKIRISFLDICFSASGLRVHMLRGWLTLNWKPFSLAHELCEDSQRWHSKRLGTGTPAAWIIDFMAWIQCRLFLLKNYRREHDKMEGN